MALQSRYSALVLTVLIAFCSCQSSPEDLTDSNGEVSGEKVYQQYCMSCHGKNGDLGVSGAADLSKSSKSIDYKIKVIKEGSSNDIMQAYGDKFGGPLNDEQIQKVAEYIETL